MEREPLRPKLVAAVSKDYPAASEILVNFPDKWELICQIEGKETFLYVAAMPPVPGQPRRYHFYSLTPGINLELTTYRLYRFFQPWPMPSVIVSWDKAAGIGQVKKIGDLKIQLRPVGQAQAWFGRTFGVLWECYLNEAGRKADWQETLYEIWQAIEKDMKVAWIFTQPREPTFQEGYTDFLSSLGYEPDSETQGWWSKAMR